MQFFLLKKSKNHNTQHQIQNVRSGDSKHRPECQIWRQQASASSDHGISQITGTAGITGHNKSQQQVTMPCTMPCTMSCTQCHAHKGCPVPKGMLVRMSTFLRLKLSNGRCALSKKRTAMDAAQPALAAGCSSLSTHPKILDTTAS